MEEAIIQGDALGEPIVPMQAVPGDPLGPIRTGAFSFVPVMEEADESPVNDDVSEKVHVISKMMIDPRGRVLFDAFKLMLEKGKAYQNESSPIKQADYYPKGIRTIGDIVWAKVLRVQSVMSALEAGKQVPFESLRDSFVDLLNYTAFGISWLDGTMPGQDADRDAFNNPKLEKVA